MMRRSLAASMAWHIALLLLLARLARPGPGAQRLDVTPVDPNASRLVWFTDPGPGGGGGGGGNRRPEPPRPLAAIGTDLVTIPVRPQASPAQDARPDPPLVQAITIPAQTLASALESIPGAIGVPPAATASLGTGDGGGGGTGSGPGQGPGNGPGLGPGDRGGNGDGFFRPGSGVTMPAELRRGTPRYTADAMRARLQGSVLVECVVEPDGACDRIRIRRGLDPSFGLNEEAVNAARQWRFRPGTRRGEPVPVLVTMEITFTLR